MEADQVDPRSVPLPGDETDAFVAVGPRGRPVKKPRRNRSSSTSSSASAMEVVPADGESGPGPTASGGAQAPPAAVRIPPVYVHGVNNVTGFYRRLIVAPGLSPANVDLKLLGGDTVKIVVRGMDVYLSLIHI